MKKSRAEEAAMIPKDLTVAVKDIKLAILQARAKAAHLANAEALKLYFFVGGYISKKTRNAKWGRGAIDALSQQLQAELPGLRGFSPMSIKYMRLFFEAWAGISEIRHLVSVEFGDPAFRHLPSDEICPMPFGELEKDDIAAFFSIGFTHHREIIRFCKDIDERVLSKSLVADVEKTIQALGGDDFCFMGREKRLIGRRRGVYRPSLLPSLPAGDGRRGTQNGQVPGGLPWAVGTVSLGIGLDVEASRGESVNRVSALRKDEQGVCRICRAGQDKATWNRHLPDTENDPGTIQAARAGDRGSQACSDRGAERRSEMRGMRNKESSFAKAMEDERGTGGPQFVGGPQFIAADNNADTPDAMNCVPPLRKHPSRNSVHEQGFRSTILYVTVCTEGRNPILAGKDMVNIILSAWANAQNWIIGRYVIMPDHIHFFCAPATYPAPDFHRWMKQWKSLAAIAWRKADNAQFTGGPQFIAADNDADTPDAMNCVPPKRNPPLFQRNCWDTQMRTGEQYEEKWQYVRNNPVRMGLAENADDWPYQGVVNDLSWHD